MSKLTITVAVATGALITLAVSAVVRARQNGNDSEEEPLNAAFRVQSSKAAPTRCTFLPSDEMHESKPQSPSYRGGCLEHVTHFKTEDGKPPPLSLFVRQQQGGSPPSWSVDGFFVGQSAHFQLTPYTPRVAGGPASRVQLYDVRTDSGENPCEDQEYEVTESERPEASWLADLKGKAIAVPGYWKDGKWHSEREDGSKSEFTLSCMSGVMAKCLLWGFTVWSEQGGDKLERLHRACVYASRADYANDRDSSYTCKNTEVDIQDREGILKKGNNKALQFESLWNENGLVCLARPRYMGCGKQLHEDGFSVDPTGALVNAKPCREPDGSPDSWQDGALIAVASSPANAVYVDGDPNPRCPSLRGAGCN
jgi:hypothetical protein